MILGCIADDFTGATDLGNNFALAGLRVEQFIGLPPSGVQTDAEVAIIALKSRTTPRDDAVAQSLAALAWLQANGAKQIYFKYCSTFDSWYAPDRFGNIGPVTEALLAQLGAGFTIATPAFPGNQRTVFKGHLFVGDKLLQESSMRDHPLTPMRDSNLVHILQGQCHGKVGLVPYEIVRAGASTIAGHCALLQQQGVAIAVVDALTDEDLNAIGEAVRDMPLVTAASGLAIGLSAVLGCGEGGSKPAFAPGQGRCAVVSGSCSAATLRQLGYAEHAGVPMLKLGSQQLQAAQVAPTDLIRSALAWAAEALRTLPQQPIVIATSAQAQDVAALQAALGPLGAASLIDTILSNIAVGLVELGVGRLVIAGGETSGACVKALGIERLQIGPQIDVGVPWCYGRKAEGQGGLHLALKSGNFGSDAFFLDAFTKLA